MPHRARRALMAAAIALPVAFAGSLAAQEVNVFQPPGETAEPMLRGTELLGMRIVNPEGDTLGRVEDLVISEPGDVRFLVFESEGGDFTTEPLSAVPWHAVRIGREEREAVLILDLSKERLAEAPHFPRREWPDLSPDSVWANRLEAYYGLPVGGTPWPSFSRLDADDDGEISRNEAEVSRRLSERFAEADVNSDGALDPTEFAALEIERPPVTTPEDPPPVDDAE